MLILTILIIFNTITSIMFWGVVHALKEDDKKQKIIEEYQQKH